MKQLCGGQNNVISSRDCALSAASFAFIYAVRFFADCFFYFYYYFKTGKHTQRACASVAR